MMRFSETAIPGCFLIEPRLLTDPRGSFVKTYHADLFAARGLNTDWREEYYSVSGQGVLRGLHFQLPPHDHEKLVYCTAGAVLDAVLDLRRGSPAFGRHLLVELAATEGTMLYLPRGVAHGFRVVGEGATMMYKVATVYAPTHDAGLLWNSAGIPWGIEAPVLSQRDAQFPPFSDFDSPFVYTPKGDPS